MENYNVLIDNRDMNFTYPDIDSSSIKEIDGIITDKGYLAFLSQFNGGFFFNNSLQLYSLNNANEYNSIIYINELFRTTYSSLLKDEFFFAQDIFANQFAFYSDGILFFNIETGEKTHLANSFIDWIDLIKSEVDYYSGRSLVVLWNENKHRLLYDERLCPKMPFVLGGEYEIKNLYNSSFPEYIFTNANIANQIFKRPDGTAIKIKTVD